VFAADVSPPEYQSSQNPGLAEIIVTAQKRSENLQNVPISVATVTGAALEANGIDTEQDLPATVPNLSMSVGSGFVAPYLRGVGTQFANVGLESSVAVYLDDVYVPRVSFGYFDFVDLNRIEVLKGPQGTLYGRNATGGAIRIITNDPVNEFEALADVAYGSYNRVIARGVLNVPMGNDLSGRFTFTSDKRDGYVTDYVPGAGDPGNRDNLLFSAKLLYKPSDSFSLKFSADYADKRDQEAEISSALTNSAPGQIGIALGGLPRNGFYNTSQDYEGPGFTTEAGGAALRADWDVGAVLLSSITGYRYAYDNQALDLDSVNLPYLNAVTNPEWTNAISEELQIISRDNGRFTWLGGLYYYHERSRQAFAVFGSSIDESFGVTPGPDVGEYGGGPGLQSNARLTVQSVAPYGQGTYAFSDQWGLTVGARWTDEKKTLTQHQVSVFGLGPPLVTLSEDEREIKFSEFTPKATLSYKPTGDVLLYLGYAKGFKSGGFNTVEFSAADAVNPEKLNSYEAGWKTEMGRVRFNGAAFYYDYKDLQVQYVNPTTGASTTENASNATIYGLETDLTIAISSHLELGAGGGYLHSQYKDYVGPALVPAAGTPACASMGGAACLGYDTKTENFSGNELTNAPKYSGYLRAKYDQPLAGDYGTLSFNTLAGFSGRFYWDSANTVAEPSRTLLSAGISWSSQNDMYHLSATGDNLIGEKYRTSVTASTDGGFYTPGLPRTWFIRAGIKFK
jgi:iron complex outermembrane receptor protein